MKPGWFFMRNNQFFRLKIVMTAATVLIGSTPAVAEKCDTRAFNVLIDQAAQTLRSLNRDSETRFQERLHAIGKAKGWTDAQMASKASDAVDDSKLGRFNSQIEELVAQLDTLSATPANEVSCDRLNELKSVRDKLVSVMGQKSGFILAELEAEARIPTQSAVNTPPASLAPPNADPSTQPIPPSAPEQKSLGQTDKASASWSANVAEALRRASQRPTTAPAPAASPPPAAAPLSLRPTPSRPDEKVASLPQPPLTPGTPMAPPTPAAVGYTVQEIRDSEKGIFGTLTSEFAGVVNYAFQKYGQPNAYIVGDEGGGAFLAGLRYGDGKLYSRLNGSDRGPVRIYWQGPSVGVDFGATGSRALFLVYNLDELQTLYRRFPGIDGSAYVVGGFGLTVFKSGNTLIVPIRTGLGLRLGASLAYLKFTKRASLNPF
jgi:hypothetical protein